MADPMPLDDILSDKEPEKKPQAEEDKKLDIPDFKEAKPEAVERPQSRRAAHRDKEQDAQGRVRDPETGQYVAKQDEEPKKEPAKEAKEPTKETPAAAAAAPQQEFTEKEKAFLRAAEEERKKRQELERRLAAALEAKPKGDLEPEKTFWDDPEGALAKHREEIRKEALNVRINASEMLARQKHTDFDEKVAVFTSLAQQNPLLGQQCVASPDPAEFAYRIGKNYNELQQAGSIDELRAKIAKEERLKVETELKDKADLLAKERAALPPSLSDARGSAPSAKPVWSGPTPLDDILGS